MALKRHFRTCSTGFKARCLLIPCYIFILLHGGSPKPSIHLLRLRLLCQRLEPTGAWPVKRSAHPLINLTATNEQHGVSFLFKKSLLLLHPSVHVGTQSVGVFNTSRRCICRAAAQFVANTLHNQF